MGTRSKVTVRSPPALKGGSAKKAMGANLGIDRSTNAREQLEVQKEKYLQFSTEQREAMDKCRALQEVNKQLTEMNHKMLRSINDVTQLLNMYVEFFDVVKLQTQQMSKDLQTGLSPADFDYIKNLTTEHSLALTDDFKKSVSDLRSMYTEYNMQAELANINDTEKSLDITVQLADKYYPELTKSSNSSKRNAPPAPPSAVPVQAAASTSRSNAATNAANAAPVFAGFSAEGTTDDDSHRPTAGAGASSARDSQSPQSFDRNANVREGNAPFRGSSSYRGRGRFGNANGSRGRGRGRWSPNTSSSPQQAPLLASPRPQAL